jgi:hypothetical protein
MEEFALAVHEIGESPRLAIDTPGHKAPDLSSSKPSMPEFHSMHFLRSSSREIYHVIPMVSRTQTDGTCIEIFEAFLCALSIPSESWSGDMGA